MVTTGKKRPMSHRIQPQTSFDWDDDNDLQPFKMTCSLAYDPFRLEFLNYLTGFTAFLATDRLIQEKGLFV